MQSAFCVGHNRGHSRGCGSSSAPLLPLPVPPWVSLQPSQGSRQSWTAVLALPLPEPSGGAPLGGLPPCPCSLPAPALELLQALRLPRPRSALPREGLGSKFSLMERLYFLFRALLLAEMAPALPPAPQGLSA